MQNVWAAIDISVREQDYISLQYNYARLARLFFIFDPVEVPPPKDDPELDYDLNDQYYKTLGPSKLKLAEENGKVSDLTSSYHISEIITGFLNQT